MALNPSAAVPPTTRTASAPATSAPTDATKKKKKASKIDPNETAAQRFSRVGTIRLNKALRMIEAVSKVAGKGYDYTPEQARKIVSSLNDEVKAVETALARTGSAGKVKVTL